MEAAGNLDQQTMTELRERWWVFLVVGLLTAFVGVLILFHPFETVLVLAILIAIAFFLSGIGSFLGAGQWNERWIPFVWGGLSIVAGIITVAWPNVTLRVVALVIGIAIIVRGLLRLWGAISAKPYLWGLWAVFGMVELLVGILAVAWPTATLVVLAIVFGLDLLIVGLVEIYGSIKIRNLS
jgi:uncharacterized membrane protein HdeD (DUF308 family)